MTDARKMLSLAEIGPRVCDIISEQMGVDRAEVHLGLRLVEDLNCDSIEMLDFFFRIEKQFGVTLPNKPPNAVYKSVFTRPSLRLADMAELIYLQQGSEPTPRRGRRSHSDDTPSPMTTPFTQLGGVVTDDEYHAEPLFESLGVNQQGRPTWRRRTDGMVCVEIPGAEVIIGSDSPDVPADERPSHRAHVAAFRMDIEPVSTTAWCRFLNSLGISAPATLRELFLLSADDKRREHELLRRDAGGPWEPLPGTERFPMILVSWYGANAYSLWANRKDWRDYRSDGREESRLPSEAEWEYAARGAEPRLYPWGNESPEPKRMWYARHQPGATYRPETLPLANVNEPLGLSPFGLRHMAGNVWQWCRDWYAPYSDGNGDGAHPTRQVRSERGGSWVGPAFLCRSSYRRGRVPSAKGRCLGFRCVGNAQL